MPQNVVVPLGRIRYQVSAVYIADMGLTMIDFVPLSRILAPLVFSQRLFALVIAMLFVTGIAMAFLLYRNVQVPIHDLLHALTQIQGGHFRTRVSLTRHNEFRYLFLRFNKMAREIDRLVNTVYQEQLRSQEAAFKQLQSQINPHFIYNCLFFIKNMARLGNEDAVIRMALHLGDYLRYTTRVENQTTLLRDELAHIANYLSIQKLRSERLDFIIDVPPEMLDLKIPRLILQPIVENAVIHGIEPNPDSNRIRVRGCVRTSTGGNDWSIEVEDDGCAGEPEVEKIRAGIAAVDGAGFGCGLRNIDQRLRLFYTPPASMLAQTSEWGGVKISLIIPSPNPA
jgi:two-component system sensor histidine kinase YesM